MSQLDNFTIGVGFDISKFNESARQVLSSVDKLSTSISTKLDTAFKLILGGSGVNFAEKLVENFMEVGAQLEYSSQTLKENVSALSLWENAVKRVGGTAQTFESTVNNLYKSINAAQTGGNPEFMKIVTNVLHVNLKDQNGQLKSRLVILREIGQALSRLPNYGNARFLAGQLGIDDATLRLIMMHNQEFNKLIDTVARSGIVTEEQAKKAADLRNQWLQTSQEWGQVKMQLAEGFLPTINAVMFAVEKLVNYLMTNKDAATMFFGSLITAAGILMMMNPFTAWLAAITALIAAVNALYYALVKVGNYYHIPEKIRAFEKGSHTDYMTGGFGMAIPINSTKPIESGSAVESAGIVKSIAANKATSVIKSAGNNLPDILAYVQGMKESSGGIHNIGGQHEKELTYGMYQVRLSTARQPESLGGLGMSLGHQVTVKDLMDPKINKMARDSYLSYGYKQMKGFVPGNAEAKAVYDAIGAEAFAQEGALALYNGGANGLNFFKRHGYSLNSYAESVLGNAQALGYNPESGALTAPMITNHNKTNSSNIGSMSINVHGVQNGKKFAADFGNSLNAWSFSGGRLA